jgi:hypothetical protein
MAPRRAATSVPVAPSSPPAPSASSTAFASTRPPLDQRRRRRLLLASRRHLARQGARTRSGGQCLFRRLEALPAVHLRHDVTCIRSISTRKARWARAATPSVGVSWRPRRHGPCGARRKWMTLRLARPPDRFREQSHGSIAPELSPLPRGRSGRPNAPAMRRSPGRGSGRRPSWSLARTGASTRRPCSAPYRVSGSVVPNVAGLVPTYRPDAGAHGTSAALEYGVRAHEVARIVVLDHARCGASEPWSRARPRPATSVEPWMTIAGSARQKARSAQSRATF